MSSNEMYGPGSGIYPDTMIVDTETEARVKEAFGVTSTATSGSGKVVTATTGTASTAPSTKAEIKDYKRYQRALRTQWATQVRHAKNKVAKARRLKHAKHLGHLSIRKYKPLKIKVTTTLAEGSMGTLLPGVMLP